MLHEKGKKKESERVGWSKEFLFLRSWGMSPYPIYECVHLLGVSLAGGVAEWRPTLLTAGKPSPPSTSEHSKTQTS